MKTWFSIAGLTNRLNIPPDSPAHWEQVRIWDRWQEESRPGVGQAYRTQREKTVNYLAGLAGPLTVLELCCGTGRLAYDLLHLEQVTKLYALDINPQAIALLQQRLQDHPRFSLLEAGRANILDLQTWDLGRVDVIICLDALPNLSWSNLPAVFRQSARMLAPGGCFIGNYLSSERVDAHTRHKHGQAGYMRIYFRLLLGKLLASLNPAFVGRQGWLRTGTIYGDELRQLLAQFFKPDCFETGVYHWFTAIVDK